MACLQQGTTSQPLASFAVGAGAHDLAGTCDVLLWEACRYADAMLAPGYAIGVGRGFADSSRPRSRPQKAKSCCRSASA